VGNFKREITGQDLEGNILGIIRELITVLDLEVSTMPMRKEGTILLGKEEMTLKEEGQTNVE
jgi:hypothetical protein